MTRSQKWPTIESSPKTIFKGKKDISLISVQSYICLHGCILFKPSRDPKLLIPWSRFSGEEHNGYIAEKARDHSNRQSQIAHLESIHFIMPTTTTVSATMAPSTPSTDAKVPRKPFGSISVNSASLPSATKVSLPCHEHVGAFSSSSSRVRLALFRACPAKFVEKAPNISSLSCHEDFYLESTGDAHKSRRSCNGLFWDF